MKTQNETNRVNTSVPLIAMVLIVISMIASCSGNNSGKEAESNNNLEAERLNAEQQAEKTVSEEELKVYVEKLCRVTGAHISGLWLDNKTATKVKIFIRKDISQGQQALPAALMLTKEAWKSAGWFRFAETEFAECWLFRVNPITQGASPQTMKALRHLAENGQSRQTRVAAAAAIIKINPGIAEKVLLQEYANFSLRPRPSFSPLSLSSGKYLGMLGIRVFPEMTHIGEYDALLRKHPIKGKQVKEDDLYNYDAANLFNQRLRKMLREESQDSIITWVELSDLAHECLNEAKRSPTTAPEESMWN